MAIAVLGAVLLALQTAPGAVVWSGAAAPDPTWWTADNWNTGIMPGAGEDVVFGNTAASDSFGAVTNIVNANITVGTLSYSQLDAFHTTGIYGILTVTGGTGASALMVGTPAQALSRYTSTMIGGPGTLAVNNAAADFTVSNVGTDYNHFGGADLDMSQLATLQATVNNFNVGVGEWTVGYVRLGHSNTITANTMTIGSGSSFSGPVSSIVLGQTNTLNINTITVGANNQSANLLFNNNLSGASVTIRGQAGGTSAANLDVGRNVTGNGSNITGTINFTSGAVDAQFDTIRLGRGSDTTNSAGAGVFSMSAGAVTAGSIIVGANDATSAIGAADGALTVKGGTLNAGSITIAQRSSSGWSSGIVELQGGVTTLSGDISGGGGSSQLILDGGGTLDMQGHSLGTATGPGRIGNLALSSGTLRNVAAINAANGNGGLTKDTGGTLILGGVNRYSGGTFITSGTLQMGSANALPTSTTVTFGGGILDLNGFNQQVAGLAGASGGIIGNWSGTSNATLTYYGGVSTFGGMIVDGPNGRTTALTVAGGNLTLTSPNHYSGPTTIAGGTLSLDYSSGGDSRISRALAIGGGTLNVLNGGSACDSLTVNPGLATINGRIDLGSIVQNIGGTLNVVSGPNVTTSTPNTNDILGGYAVVGNNWAVGSGVIQAFASYLPLPDFESAPTSNALLTESKMLTGPVAVNSLKIDPSSNGQSLNLMGATLSLTSGGLLYTGTFPYWVVNGSLGDNNSNMIVHCNGSGTLTLDTSISGGNGSLTKSGTGTLVLNRPLTFTGGLFVNDGRLQFSSADGNVVTVNGSGVLDLYSLSKTIVALNGNGTVDSIGSTATLTLGNNNGSGSFSGVIRNSGGTLSLVKIGQGTQVLGGHNTYTGTTKIQGGTLKLGTDNALPTSTTVTFGGGILDLNGFNQQVAGLAPPSDGVIGNWSGTSNATLTYYGGVSTFGGAIVDGPNGRTTALTLAGGTLVLSGANAYSGGTIVEGGVLQAANDRAFGQPTAASLTFGANSTGTVQLNGNSITIVGLNTNAATPGWPIVENGSGNYALLTVNNQAANTFGGVLRNGAGGLLGLDKYGDGTLTLTGANTYTGPTAINGGTLKVAAGGQVVSSSAYVGNNPGPPGLPVTLTVTGTNSKWTNSSDLYVGGYGSGTLNVEAGGQVSNKFGYLGYDSGSTGTATVTGTNSTWTNSSDLYVGKLGGGTLNVEAGGQVSNNYGYLGYNFGSTGTATVSGASSTWINSHPLYVGYSGSGVLNIGSGGLVRASWGLTLAQDGWSTGECNINNGGKLQATTITRGTGVANFNWNDGTIQNYDANTNLSIPSGLTLKLAATGTHTFNIDLNRTATVSAVLSDATIGGTLTKTGVGTLVLAGPNTYTGGTIIDAGILQARSSTAFGPVTGASLTFTAGSNGKVQLFGNTMMVVGLNTNAAIPGTPIIENGSGSYATLTVNNATDNTFAGTLQGGSGGLGLGKSGNGILTLTGMNTSLGVTTVNGGVLKIASGGQVSNSSCYIGYDSGSNGTATVTGANSKWTNWGDFVIGKLGGGTLDISASGQVSNTSGYLGYDSGSTGTATVTGTNSKWTNSSGLYVGKLGGGTLNVSASGQVGDTSGYLGYDSGSTGTATVTGTNSKWTNSSNLYIGKLGGGMLNVAAGGQVSNTSGYLGSDSGSTGTATVTGTNSKWTNGSDLYVGKLGGGMLNVAAGGQVSNTSGYLGSDSGSTGTATVTGTNSKWTNSSDLYVGKLGGGTLNVAVGGQVSDTSGYLGYDSGSTGAATVTGTGSTWTNSSNLYVGDYGSGTLNVEAGGQVSNAHGILAYYPGSTGTATVAGAGSKWTNNGDLLIGKLGGGTLNVQSGGQVSSATGSLGVFSGVTGTATVNGTGSTWTNSSNLYVGDYGSGILNIAAGGQVSNTYGYLGYNSGSTGTATVTGTGSTWTNTGSLYVGYSGSGTLNIGGGSDSGGLVKATALALANSSNSAGICNIDNGGTLQAATITRDAGVANFNWNDGTIQNYDASTDLSIRGGLSLKLAATGTHTFNIDLNRTATVGAVLADATTQGTLAKTGAGTLTLNGLNTYTGKTTITDGTLRLNGTLAGKDFAIDHGSLVIDDAPHFVSDYIFYVPNTGRGVPLNPSASGWSPPYCWSATPSDLAFLQASGLPNPLPTPDSYVLIIEDMSLSTPWDASVLIEPQPDGSVKATNYGGHGHGYIHQLLDPYGNVVFSRFERGDSWTVAGNTYTNRIADDSTIALNGGNFIYKDGMTETIGAIRGTGNSTVTVSNFSTLTAESLTHVAGNGSILVNGQSLGCPNIPGSPTIRARFLVSAMPTRVGTRDGVPFSTATDNKIVPFLVGESTSFTGGPEGPGTETGVANTFVTYDPVYGFRPLDPTHEFANNVIAATYNTYITQPTTAASTVAINSLVINGANLTINDGVTLANTSGAFLFCSSHEIKANVSGQPGQLAVSSDTSEYMVTVNTGVVAKISAVLTSTTGAECLTKSGAGTLVLSGANTHAGDTTIAAGTLQLANNLALQNSALNTSGAGTLAFSPGINTPTFGGLSGSGNLTLPSSVTALTLNPGEGVSKTYSGILDNATPGMTLTKTGAGAQVLAGANTYSGGTAITAGILVAGHADALGTTGTITNDATLAIAAGITFTRPVSWGNSSVLGGSGTYKPGGTFTVGTAGNPSALSPGIGSGGIGTLTIGNHLALDGATLTWEAISTSNCDKVAVQGNLSLNNSNTLSVQTVVGGTYDIMSYTGSLTGSAANLKVSVLPGTFHAGTYAVDTNTPGIVKMVVSGGGGNYHLIWSGSTSNEWKVPSPKNWIGGDSTFCNGDTVTFDDSSSVGNIQLIKPSATVALQPASVTVNNSSTAYTFNGEPISGTGGLNKSGNGTLTINTANTFTGDTILSGGTLTLGHANALQGSTLNSSYYGNGMLSFGTLTSATLGGLKGNWSLQLSNDNMEPVTLSVGANNRSTTLSGNLNGPGSLKKIGTGTLTLTGWNNHSGDTILSEGTLELDNNNGNGLWNSTLIADGGALSSTDPSYPLMLGGLKGSGNLNLNFFMLDVGNNGQSTTYSGVLSGPTGLTKVGGGTLTLSGANTFTGDTIVSDGTLTLGHANALQASTLSSNHYGNGMLSFGTLTSATLGGLNGELYVRLFNDNMEPVTLSVGANNQSTIFSGGLNGSGSLKKIGTGTLTLSGGIYHSGDTILSEGTLELDNGSCLWDSTLNAAGGTLNTTDSFMPTRLGGLKGSGNLSPNFSMLDVGNNGQSTTYSGVLSGPTGLTKVGDGTLTLSGANTFTGDTIVRNGALKLGGANALQGSTLNYSSNYGNGMLSFGTLGSATLGGLTGDRSLQLVNDNMEPVMLLVGANNQSTSFSGSLDGPGSLRKIGTGTLTLTGNNNHTGDTILSEGTLVLSNGSGLKNSTLNADGGALSTTNSFMPVMLGGLTGSGNLSLNSFTLDVGTNGQSTAYNGILSGLVGLTKSGPGTLTLSGANTYTGDTFVFGGTLKLDSTSALQGSTLNYSSNYGNGMLSFGTLGSATLGGLKGNRSLQLSNDNMEPVTLSVGANNRSTSFSGNLSGPGSLRKIGSGTLTLTGNNNHTGDTILSEGTLVLSGGLPNSTLSADGGALSTTTPSMPVTLGGLKGSGNLSLNFSRLDVGNNGQSTTYSGVLSGAVGLAKGGPGTLTLSGANTFSGDTSVYGGTLTLGHANALQGSTFDYSGRGVLSFGTLTSATLGGLKGNGSLWLANDNMDPVTLSVGANNRSTTFGSLNGPGSFKKIGTGTLTLTGWSNYSGDTVLSAGTLELGNSNPLGNSTLIADGGALTATDVFMPVTIGGLKGSGNLSLNFSRLDVGNNGQSTTYSGVLSGPAGLTKSGPGTLTLTGANTFTGNTIVSGGTLALSGANSLGSGGVTLNGAALYINNATALGSGSLAVFGGAIDNTSGGTIINSGANAITIGADLIFTGTQSLNLGMGPVALGSTTRNWTISANTLTLGGVLSGTAGITKMGAGRLILSGNNTYTGLTTVQAGTLELATAAQNAVLSLGGADIQGGMMVFDYTGSSPAETIAGLLKTSRDTGWNGQIKSSTAATTGLALGWKDDPVTKRVTVMTTYAGDWDLNGAVNLDDLNIWKANFGIVTGAIFAQGDFDYNGAVNLDDLNAWKATFGLTPLSTMASQSIGAGSLPLSAPVPEPSTVALLLAGLLGLASYAWRRRK